MRSLTIPARTYEFLDACASSVGVTLASILEDKLGARPIRSYPEAAAHISRLSADILPVLDALDWRLRTANPGSQMVFRSEYIGYRRSDPRVPGGVQSIRSQIYASLLCRKRSIRVVLPVISDHYEGSPGVLNLGGKGHHGVGDTAFSVQSEEDIDQLMSVFDSWLGPARQPTSTNAG